MPLCDIKETTFPFSVRTDKTENLFWVVDERSGHAITTKSLNKKLAQAFAKQQYQQLKEETSYA